MFNNPQPQLFAAKSESAIVSPSAKEAMAKRILTKLGEAPGAGRLPPNPRRKPRTGKRVRIDKSIQRRIREMIEDMPALDFGWDVVVEAANARYGASWTRQSLSSHSTIRNAFQDKKKALAEARPRRRAPEATYEYLEHQIRHLTAENGALRAELAVAKARLARWRQNAFLHGMTLPQLDAEMQANDRGRSDR